MSVSATFRNEIREWLEENCPQSVRGLESYYAGGMKNSFPSQDIEHWFNRCLERGFTVPAWPVEYGGAALQQGELTVLAQEMLEIGAPKPLAGMGVNLIGSTLLEFGTDEQKARHLPLIASGKVRWCQGYSEPGAGSDLASLQTKAESDGDEYVINGSKIWTSGADRSDWIFCLVRTNTKVAKHDGISFLLFSMDSPGVSVKPIDLIGGSSDFCQVFFTDVRASKKDLLGKENQGWAVAKRLLQYERFTVTEPGASGFSLSIGGLPEIARKFSGEIQGRISDNSLRDRIIRNEMDASALKLTTDRIKQENSSDTVTVATSILKYCSTEITCEEDEIRLQAMGHQGFGWEGNSFSGWELEMARKWISNKALRIAGGTSEVQLNVIAKRVLLLPD